MMISQDMIAKIESNEVEFVRVEMADVNGCSRGFLVDADYYLDQCKNGFNLTQASLSMSNCGNLVFETGYLENVSYKDGTLYPDSKTFEVLPWTDKTARVLTDFRSENFDPESPYISSSPRAICKQQLEKLNAIGMRLYSAFEFEFYLMNKESKKSLDDEINFCAMLTGIRHAQLIQDIMRNMKKIDIIPQRYHPEFGPSQHELTHQPAFGIAGSDNAFRYKQLVKELALKHNCMATFMTKPYPNYSASSGHFNHSLWDMNGNTLLYEKDQMYGLSQIAQHWLAGIIHHTDSLMCLASSTPNCYERTNVGAFAPVNNSWGLDNRSVAYRVKNSSTERLFFENRLSPSAVNPYLLTAGCIIAGMDGIKRKLPLKGNPYDGEIKMATKLPDDVKPLPKSLSESLDCLLNNKIFEEELGVEFLKCFAAFKRNEEELAHGKRESGELYQWYMDYYGTYI